MNCCNLELDRVKHDSFFQGISVNIFDLFGLWSKETGLNYLLVDLALPKAVARDYSFDLIQYSRLSGVPGLWCRCCM